MEEWKSKKIKEVCSIGRGRVINQDELRLHPGIYPVYSSQSFNKGEMGRIDSYDFEGKYVTWTTDGAYAGTVFFREGKFNCTNVCGTLKPKVDEEIDLEFLAYLLSTEAKKHVSYVGNPKLMNGVMGEIVLYLPTSFTEQTHIANILSTADEAIAQTEQLIAKYQRIKTGLMQDLLTKGIDAHGNIRNKATHKFIVKNGVEVPEEWEVEELGEVYKGMSSGSTPLREKKEYFEEGEFLWVKTLDLNEGYINSTQEKITRLALKETSCKLFQVDSVLVAMYGGWEQIGRTAILQKEATTNQAITALFNPCINIKSEYTQYYLQYFRYKWKVFAVSTRKDPNITKSDIELFKLAFPKSEIEQEAILNSLNSAKKDIEDLQHNLQKLHSLKTGLMQDLLSGRVRVNDLKE